MKHRPRSFEELEFIAEHFLSGFDRRCFKGDVVDIERIVEAGEYIIWPVPGLARYSRGFVPVMGNKIYVDEDVQNYQPLEYRFTLAEEQAHILIHAPYFEGWKTVAIQAFTRSLSRRDYVFYEREARYLAACLLMPERVFSERVKRFTDVVIALEGDRHSEVLVVHRLLARFFDVDERAAARRYFELRRLRASRRLQRGNQLLLPISYAS